MAAYVRTISTWRCARYNDDLRDARNLQSADALLAFADWVEQLPLDDPRLDRLAFLAGEGESFAPGQQTAYEIGRFHFHDQAMTNDGFLTWLVSLAEQDAGERGRFGGRQVPGDEPW
jgi:hypothetical protein